MCATGISEAGTRKMERRVAPAAEMHRRSIVKAVTWRLMGTTGTCLVSWWITGSLKTGLGISLVDAAIKIGCFYIHERAWHKVQWGLVSPGSGYQRGEGI